MIGYHQLSESPTMANRVMNLLTTTPKVGPFSLAKNN